MSSSVVDKLYICLKALVKLESGPSWAVWECAPKAARQVLGGPGNRETNFSLISNWCLMNPAHRHCAMRRFCSCSEQPKDPILELLTALKFPPHYLLPLHSSVLGVTILCWDTKPCWVTTLLPLMLLHLHYFAPHSQVNIASFPCPPQEPSWGTECLTPGPGHWTVSVGNELPPERCSCLLEKTHPI